MYGPIVYRLGRFLLKEKSRVRFSVGSCLKKISVKLDFVFVWWLNNIMKKIYWLLIIIVIIVAGVVVINKEKDSNDIKIGFVGPLSGFGAPWGEESKEAVEIAVKEINDGGGIKNKKLEVIYEDGKCASKEAVNAAHKLISVDQVKIILTVCGQESMAIAPLAEKNKVIMMAMWSTPPKLSGIGQRVQ